MWDWGRQDAKVWNGVKDCVMSYRSEGEAQGEDRAAFGRVSRGERAAVFEEVFADWQIVVIHDDAGVARSVPDFLWATWTRFEPASDIHAAETKVMRHHLAYTSPIVIDARMKPGYPDELLARDDIARLVDTRWDEYFPRGMK